MNQDGILADFRRQAAKDDPPPYTVQMRHGQPFVWMSVNSNEGWYAPRIEQGVLVGLRSEALPPYEPEEAPQDTKALDYAVRFVGTKQAAKVIEAVNQFRSAGVVRTQATEGN